MKLRCLVIVLASFLSLGEQGYAQWKIVSSSALSGFGQAAIHYKDGLIWAGTGKLVYSTDTGATWNATNFPINSDVEDIAFISKDTGFVISYDGLWLTKDRGKFWGKVPMGTSSDFSKRIAFASQARTFHAYLCNPPRMLTSKDFGKNWTSATLGAGDNIGVGFTAGKSGALYAMVGGIGAPHLAHVFASTDDGLSWQQTAGTFDADCYSIEVDSCDDSKLYVANEDMVDRYLPTSHLYVSSDAGASWSATFSSPLPGIAGAFVSSQNAQYAATIANGVLRSTDHGVTWMNIGGPNSFQDTRSLCVVNDNIVFGIDSLGRIWATFNSGGDSIKATASSAAAPSVWPDSLFQTDTLACGVRVSGSVSISSVGCSSPSLVDHTISGEDASSYSLASIGSAGATLVFTPRHSGGHSAILTLRFSNGSADTVQLHGAGAAASILSVVSVDQTTDTIGAEIIVPITINGLIKPETVELVIHYDSILTYIGSFDAANAKADIAGEQWAGRSKIRLTSIASGALVASAHFYAFARSLDAQKIRIDSVRVLTANTPCDYGGLATAMVNVILPTGCASPFISALLRGEPIPLSIYPNPTSGSISIVSDRPISNAVIEVYDALGTLRSSFEISLSKETVSLVLPSVDGIYYLRTRTALGESGRRIVLQR